MHFQLDITLTEEDYLAFNDFQSLQSPHGKKQIRKSKIVYAAVMAFFMLLVVLIVGWTIFSATYVIVIGLFTVQYLLLYRKRFRRNMKRHLNRLKKIGKLPFSPASKLEFYDDKLVEITTTTRVEQSYHAIERIYVVGERFILLYNSSVEAHVIPIPQLRMQVDQEEFLSFLSQKCNTVEYYQLKD